MGAIGLLPWLSRTDPALTVLKARSAERDPTPVTLRAVRAELGLDDGPLHLLGRWLGGLLHGDAGTSWVSGSEVLPGVAEALGVSLLLMSGALVVAALTAAAVCARTLRLGARRRLGGRQSAGSAAAVTAALPEFLVASVLASVIGVQLGWLPALGWYGPQWTVLPSLALGLPAAHRLPRHRRRRDAARGRGRRPRLGECAGQQIVQHPPEDRPGPSSSPRPCSPCWGRWR